MTWLKIEDLALQYRDTLYMLNRKLVKIVESAKEKKKLVECPQYLELISEIGEVKEKWCQLKKYCIARGLGQNAEWSNCCSAKCAFGLSGASASLASAANN